MTQPNDGGKERAMLMRLIVIRSRALPERIRLVPGSGRPQVGQPAQLSAQWAVRPARRSAWSLEALSAAWPARRQVKASIPASKMLSGVKHTAISLSDKAGLMMITPA